MGSPWHYIPITALVVLSQLKLRDFSACHSLAGPTSAKLVGRGRGISAAHTLLHFLRRPILDHLALVSKV